MLLSEREVSKLDILQRLDRLIGEINWLLYPEEQDTTGEGHSAEVYALWLVIVERDLQEIRKDLANS